jgi:putative ubiquitin-RnfH superfamily antitoxin RatB of RatAB toxin-antitoxin module
VNAGELIPIEVAYATPEKQQLLSLDVPMGSTVEDAIQRSGILEMYPEIDLATQKLGIWSKIGQRDQILQSRDRVEIYRSLKADPKEARRRRAQQA